MNIITEHENDEGSTRIKAVQVILNPRDKVWCHKCTEFLVIEELVVRNIGNGERGLGCPTCNDYLVIPEERIRVTTRRRRRRT